MSLQALSGVVPSKTMGIFGRNLKCEMCGMTFKSDKEMRAHSVVHGQPPEAPLSLTCAACGMAFPNEVEVQRHGKQHQGM